MREAPPDQVESTKATPYTLPPELQATYWGSLASAADPRMDKSDYKTGSLPPRPDQLTRRMQAMLRASQGVDDLNEKDGQALIKTGWTYGQPAPKGYEYDENGVLNKKGNVWKAIGKAALIAAPVAATIATGGVASPWLAAAIGGAAGVGAAKLGGASWKQALIAGGIGAATGGIGASSLGTAAKTAAQTGVGAAGGVAQGGGAKGALLGAAGGAASAIPSGGAGQVASATAKTTGGGMNTLTQTLIQAGIGAAAGGVTGGAKGAALGAAGGAASAVAGSKNPNIAAAGKAGQAGTSLASKILSGAQAGTTAMGAAAAGREAGRETETNNLVTQDQQRLQAQIAAENAKQGRAEIDITRRKDTREASSDAYKNALRSSLALNTKDVTATRPTGVPNISFSGGGRPSALGAQGRQAAEIMNQRSLERLLNPEAYAAMDPLETFTPSALPKPTGVDTALGVGGAIGKALEAFQTSQTAQKQNGLVAELIRRSQQEAGDGLDVKVRDLGGFVAPQTPKPTPVVPGQLPGQRQAPTWPDDEGYW